MNIVDQGPDFLNINSDVISISKEDSGGSEITNSWRCPCQNNRSRLKGSPLRQVGHKFGNPEDQVTGVAILDNFVIVDCFDFQVSGVRNNARRDQGRA